MPGAPSERAPLVIETSGHVEAETGGMVAVRWDEGRYVYVSVPPGAVSTRYALGVVIVDAGDAYAVTFSPERLVLERPMEVRIELDPDGIVKRARDGSIVEGRAIPGALVIEVTDLSEVFEVTRGIP